MQLFYTYGLGPLAIENTTPPSRSGPENHWCLQSAADDQSRLCEMTAAWPTAFPCKTGGLCEHQPAGNDRGSLGAGHCSGAWRTCCPGPHAPKRGLLDTSQHLGLLGCQCCKAPQPQRSCKLFCFHSLLLLSF